MGTALFIFIIGAVLAAIVALSTSNSNMRKRIEAAPTAGLMPGVDLNQLDAQANSALMAADDLVHTADQELAFAQAQFSSSETQAFAKAIDSAKAELSRAFELRRLLDDDRPETPVQRHHMLNELLDRCQRATNAIKSQEQQFASKRDVLANIPDTLSQLNIQVNEVRVSIENARSLLVALSATYPAESLASVADAPERAAKLLKAAQVTAAQAKETYEAGNSVLALEQIRLATSTVTQAGELANQVMATRSLLENAAANLTAAITSISSDIEDARRLGQPNGPVPAAVLDPLVARAQRAIAAGQRVLSQSQLDPVAPLNELTAAEAALDNALEQARSQEEVHNRARAGLDQRLGRLNASIDAVTNMISTARGAVGIAARTDLAEASRLASEAKQTIKNDPVRAGQAIGHAEQLIGRAQGQAQRDINRFNANQPRAIGSSGIDMGTMMLGGILLGDVIGNVTRSIGNHDWGGGPDFGDSDIDFGDFF